MSGSWESIFPGRKRVDAATEKSILLYYLIGQSLPGWMPDYYLPLSHIYDPLEWLYFNVEWIKEFYDWYEQFFPWWQ